MSTTPEHAIDRAEFFRPLSDAFDDRVDGLHEDMLLREQEGWDSIASVSIVAMVFAEYDVQITGDELVGLKTPGDLIRLIEEKRSSSA